MKDTRVETANEGMFIIILFPTEQTIQQVAPILVSLQWNSKIKHQVSKVYWIISTGKESDKMALASTLCIQMQICLRNRLYSSSRHGRIRRGRE